MSAAPGRDPSAFSRPPAALSELLADELDQASAFVSGLPEALTFFGGAAVRPGSAVFERGERWGRALLGANLACEAPGIARDAIALWRLSPEASRAAQAVLLGLGGGSLRGAREGAVLGASAGALGGASGGAGGFGALRPRTGAGPGMMDAVPSGYVAERERLFEALPAARARLARRLETQGARMTNLAAEETPSAAIERSAGFAHFIPRRYGLVEGAAGFVVFPGGVGTLNEVFEVMRAGMPLVFDGSSFWKDIMDTLVAGWRARDLVPSDDLACFRVVDGESAALADLGTEAPAPRLDATAQKARGAALAAEIRRGIEEIRAEPPAVTFLGGRLLRDDDPEVAVAEGLARSLSAAGVPLRVGSDRALARAIRRGAEAGAGSAEGVHAILEDHADLDFERLRRELGRANTVHGSEAHKLLMYENTRAIVALPGGKGTFDEVWEIACLLKTGNLPERPLILVGKAFWTPFLEKCAAAMEDPSHQTVPPGYFAGLKVVDTLEEAEALLRG